MKQRFHLTIVLSTLAGSDNLVNEPSLTLEVKPETCSDWSGWEGCTCERDAIQFRHKICKFQYEGQGIEVKRTESQTGACPPCKPKLTWVLHTGVYLKQL